MDIVKRKNIKDNKVKWYLLLKSFQSQLITSKFLYMKQGYVKKLSKVKSYLES